MATAARDKCALQSNSRNPTSLFCSWTRVIHLNLALCLINNHELWHWNSLFIIILMIKVHNQSQPWIHIFWYICFCVCIGGVAVVHLAEAHSRWDASGHEERSQSEIRCSAVQHHVHVPSRKRQVKHSI